MLPEPAVPAPSAGVPPALVESSSFATPEQLMRIGALLLAGLALCLVAYVIKTAPGAWFPAAAQKAWTARDLTLARGAGRLENDELIITAADSSNLTIVSVDVDLRSVDYPLLGWIAIGLAEDADAQLLWRNSYEPGRLNAMAIPIEGSRSLPVSVVKNPRWIGEIKGIALAIRGPLAQPVRVRGLVAKPMGVVEILQDRVREWFAFEGWTGTSINTVVGGADVQELYMPVLLAAAILVATAMAFAIKRAQPRLLDVPLTAVLAVLFFGGWFLLDARTQYNYVRQALDSAQRYAGKSSAQKHMQAEDGDLFAFVQQALKLLPKTPARVFIAADADYFRGRAAYHLYPHSVYFDPRNPALPAAGYLHSGDWLLVYDQPHVKFDETRSMLNWSGGNARAKRALTAPNAALYRFD